VGRNKLPKEVKMLAGTYRPSRDNAGGRLELPNGPLRCPPGTPRPIRLQFARLLRELGPVGFLRPVDVDNLLTLASAIVAQREAARGLAEHGLVIPDPAHGGRMAKSPYWQIWREAGSVIATLGARFGLSPADRERLSGAGDDGESDSDLEAVLREILSDDERPPRRGDG